MARKFTCKQVREALIDRFYGVSYEQIREEYGISKDLMKQIINKPERYKNVVYGYALTQALLELEVLYEEYLEELKKHAVTRSAKTRTGMPSGSRTLTRKQVYEILHVLFKKPITSADAAQELGINKSIIHRIRHQQSYQEITAEYIRLHRITTPEKYLSEAPNGRGKNGYPIVTDDHVRRFFYSYMAGATRKKAMADAHISEHTMYPLLALKHPTKNDLMLELIISEGFTPSVFKEYVRKKDIRTQKDGRRAFHLRKKRLKVLQER